MQSVLDMSSYKEVTQPHNKQLLKNVLSKDIHDAGYMPVTRDLSQNKIRMIQEWLERQCYSTADCATIDECTIPPTSSRIMQENDYERCGNRSVPKQSDVHKYLKHVYTFATSPQLVTQAEILPRPLFGYGSEQGLTIATSTSSDFLRSPLCNLESLKLQLQLAVQLEFATIPLYLTSLYTIMQGCNVAAYQLMRNIIVQEMLHYAQAANILIAIGGKVRIDNKETVPHYPTTGLPGGVLPNITLTLEKFTMKHVYENFMALKVPAYTTVLQPKQHWNTIGQFYNEIQKCMVSMGDEIFGRTNETIQVLWPWKVPMMLVHCTR